MRMLTMTALVFGLIGASPPAVAEETAPTEPFDLTALTCWEVISLPEQDAGFVMAMLIGYEMGDRSAPETTAQTIVERVERLDAACAETPDQPAIDVLR